MTEKEILNKALKRIVDSTPTYMKVSFEIVCFTVSKIKIGLYEITFHFDDKDNLEGITPFKYSK